MSKCLTYVCLTNNHFTFFFSLPKTTAFLERAEVRTEVPRSYFAWVTRMWNLDQSKTSSNTFSKRIVFLSPAQTIKFSLTSFLVAFLTRVYDEQVFFPNNIPWQVLIARVYSWSFPWLKAPHRRLVFLDKFYLLVCTTLIDKFFLDKEPCSKAGMTSFWTRFLVKEKLVNLCRTHEQIKLVKEN